MSDSLSVVWPVRNAERDLARQVHDLVELLPELTARFELLVVDDGSTDLTDEVASDLAQQYPQVRFVRGAIPAGPAEAASRAIDSAQGDYVYLHSEIGAIDASELRRQWMLRHRPLRAELQLRRPRNLVSRLSDWAQQVSAMADQTLVAPASRLFRRDQSSVKPMESHVSARMASHVEA